VAEVWFALERFKARPGLDSGSGVVLRRFPGALDGGVSGSASSCVFPIELRFGFLPMYNKDLTQTQSGGNAYGEVL
jgi:hypothetical protein